MKLKAKLILPLLLMVFAGQPALAQTQVYTELDVTYAVTVFESDFPSEVNDALQALGLAQGEPMRGAMVSSVWTESDDPRGKDDPRYPAYVQHSIQRGTYAIALCVLRQNGVDRVVGLRRSAEGVWRATMASDRVVLPGRDYTLTVAPEYDHWLHPLFTFTYPRADGGSDVYALTDFSRGDWRVAWYEDRQADGTGLNIASGDVRAYYQLYDLPKTEDYTLRLRDYTCYTHPYLSYGALLDAGDIADFPTTEADAQRLAQQSIDALPRDGVLIGGSVNLRKKPSTSSQSLGRYYSGTIGAYVDDAAAEKKGWYKVRVGSAEGYISGDYCVPVTAYAASLAVSSQLELVAAYLPLGKLKSDCALRAAPDSASAELQALAQGAEVQVMGVVNENWLHVTLTPWGEVMRRDAPSGYLPADAVEVTDAE